MPAPSKKQQRFMGMVHAFQKSGGNMKASEKVKGAAKTIGKAAAKEFASTQHEGLPNRAKPMMGQRVKVRHVRSA